MKITMKVRDNIQKFFYHGANINNCLPIKLVENVDYVMAVDPSTTATAIVVGNLVDNKADIFLELNKDVEIDDTEFNREVYDLINNFFTENKKNLVAVIVEKPFRHSKTTTVKFAKQRANFNLWSSMCVRHEIDFIDVSPQSWRGTFTRVYGRFIKGDKRKVSKTVIKNIYGGQECLDLLDMSTDVSDAYGIFKYYLDKYKGDLKATKERDREYKHKIIFNIVSLEYLSEFTERYLTAQLEKGHKSKPITFTYCNDISPEDNIRCFTSVNNAKKYNVYVSPFLPAIDNIRYLYKYKRTIPKKINGDTQLFLIGYRIN